MTESPCERRGAKSGAESPEVSAEAGGNSETGKGKYRAHGDGEQNHRRRQKTRGERRHPGSRVTNRWHDRCFQYRQVTKGALR